MARKPLVALVGRPNVGKSTLFNRLVGERLAVTNPIPGTTRDRLHGESYWNGVYFRVVDTGGIEVYQPKGTRDENPLAEGSAQFIPLIRKQAMIAIEQAEVIILVVDIHHGITAADREITEILRRSSKPVVVAANKADDLVHGDDHFEFYALGVGEVIPCSAVHGVGVGDLLDEVIRVLPEGDWMDSSNRENEHMHIAIVGRPNAGKSTLVNKLIGEERVIVSPIAGTTRDAIDTEISWHGQPITLIDTAGIRRRGRVEPGVEQFSVIRAMNAIERCDVAVLVVDAIEGVTEQDEHIAGYVIDQYKSLVVIINKWDAVEKESTTMLRFDEEARKRLHFVPYVTFIYISALTGQRIHQVLEAANRVYETRHFRIPTSEVNRILRAAIQHHPPTTRGTRRLKIYFGSQVRIAPPVILFHANDRSLVHFTYRRYLENSIRDKFAFEGTPIRLSFRSAQSAPRNDNGVSVTMARDDEADADLDMPDYEYFMSNEDEQDSFVEFDAAARDQAVDSEGYYTDAPDDEDQA